MVKSDYANELLVAVEVVLHGTRFVSSRFTGFDFTPTEWQSLDKFRQVGTPLYSRGCSGRRWSGVLSKQA